MKNCKTSTLPYNTRNNILNIKDKEIRYNKE